MKRLLWLLLFPVWAWAGDCSIVSIGPQVTGTGALSFASSMPATYAAGDVFLLHVGSFGATDASTVDPVGWTLVKQGPNSSEEIWGLLAVASSGITGPSITFNGTSSKVGYITAVRNTSGFPAIASILGDSATGTNSTVAGIRFGALSVTQGGECAFQFGVKVGTDFNTNPISAVSVQSGYVTAGYAVRNTSNGLLLASQLFATDATVPDLAQNDQTTTGNTTASGSRRTSLTLLSADITPAAFTFTDITGATISTQYVSDTKTVTAITNFTSISSSLTCQYNINGGAYTNVAGTIALNDTFTARLTSSSAASTAEACVVTVGGVSDTYTVTTAAPATPEATDSPPVLVMDLMTGVNGTSIAAHTPDIDDLGDGWFIDNFLNSVSPSTATIQSNRLSTDSHTAAFIDTGYRDHVLTATWLPGAGNGVSVGVRYGGDTNYWVCRYSKAGSLVRLGKRVSGTFTSMGTATVSFPEVSHQLTAFASGNVIGCVVDGVLKVSATDTFNNTATIAGLGSEFVTEAQVFDDVYVMRAYNSILTDTGRPADDPLGFFLGERPAVGSTFWADTLPTKAYVSWMMFHGGSWSYDPEPSFAGTDTFAIRAFDAATNSISRGTVTYTTQAVTPLTPPSWGEIPDQTWPIGVPVSLDLCAYLTTPGIPPSTLAVQAGALPTGVVFLDTCVIAGTPSVAGDYTTTIRATNSQGTDDDLFLTTVTQEDTGGGGPVTCSDIPNQYLEVGDTVNLDLNQYCVNVVSYDCSAAPVGVARSGGVFSGTTSVVSRVQTQCQASSAFGSVNPRITWIVGEVCAKIDHSPAPNAYVTATCPKKRGKVWNDGIWQ